MALIDPNQLNVTPKIERVECPEWGGYVCVKQVSANRGKLFRDLVERAQQTDDTETYMQVAWCITCCCDDDGNPLFGEEHFETLANGLAMPLGRVSARAVELNTVDGDLAENPTDVSPSG